jgi:hypothetical protein
MNPALPSRWLLVADTSIPEALGSKLSQAAIGIGCVPAIAYSSPALIYSPSMARLRGKIFYRLADRRSWEWWPFQNHLLEQIERVRPQLMLVTGILPLQPRVFAAVAAAGGHVVNWLTDDPWNPIHHRHSFIANLPLYSHIFSTKQALQHRLRSAGVRSTSWLPFAHHPPLHQPPPPATTADLERYTAGVAFVGTGARERLPWLAAAARAAANQRCHLYGNSWQGLATPGWHRYGAVQGVDYCKALYHARVVLGLLRAANHDRSTDRSYEIGAIGACGLMQDSDEHRALLPGYPDEGFFATPQQLQQRLQLLLMDDQLCGQLRSLAAQALRLPEHSVAARLQTIWAWWAQQQ